MLKDCNPQTAPPAAPAPPPKAVPWLLLETTAAGLARVGYFVNLDRQRDGWVCTLANSRLRAIPKGLGETAFDALTAANTERLKYEADPTYIVKGAG